jgi:hypothetical protein
LPRNAADGLFTKPSIFVCHLFPFYSFCSTQNIPTTSLSQILTYRLGEWGNTDGNGLFLKE